MNNAEMAATLVSGKTLVCVFNTHLCFAFLFDPVGDRIFVRYVPNPQYPDSNRYLGLYDPAHGWIRLTNGSGYAEHHEAVRCIRWLVGRIFNDGVEELYQHGWGVEFRPQQEAALCQ